MHFTYRCMYVCRYLFFIWRLNVVILMRANPLLGPLEGVGPENPAPYKQQVHLQIKQLPISSSQHYIQSMQLLHTVHSPVVAVLSSYRSLCWPFLSFLKFFLRYYFPPIKIANLLLSLVHALKSLISIFLFFSIFLKEPLYMLLSKSWDEGWSSGKGINCIFLLQTP